MTAVLCMHAAIFAVEIETAMAETAVQFSKTLKAGSTIAIIGISSDTEAMSDFMLDELTVNFVKQRKLKVADRANLAAIKKEMNFQLSGEVGDDSIQQIGAMAGYGRYSGGQQFGIGVGNWFFGTGSYVTGHFIDGAVLSAWHITNIGLIVGGVAVMNTRDFGAAIAMETLGSLSSIGAIMYGFIRPKFYTKRPSIAAGAADVLSGFNLAFVPLENGSVAPCLAYSISF